MKFLILTISLISSVCSYGQFTQVYFGFNEGVNNVEVLDDTVYFLGYNYIAKTGDFGVNMIHSNIPNLLPYNYALKVIDSTTYYFIEGDFNSNPAEFHIYKTMDAGLNWSSIYDTSSPLLDLTLSPNGNMLATGTGGNVFYTHDGINWQNTFMGNNIHLNECEAIDDSNFIVGGYFHSALTTDTCISWQSDFFNESYCSEFEIFSADTIYMSSYYWDPDESFFSKSFDGGQSWNTTSIAMGVKLYDIEFLNPNHGFGAGYDPVSGHGLVFETTDAGDSWIIYDTQHSSQLSDIAIAQDSILFVIGTDGLILKSEIMTLGLDENYTAKSNKTVVRILDLMGREVEFEPNMVLIYQYSDGSMEKVFKLE